MTATPKSRTLADGTVVWRVAFRLVKGGRPTSETFATPEAAAEFSALVDQVGGAAARRIREATTAAGGNAITCSTAFEAYCDHAGAYAAPGTITKYQRNWARHIAPAFGPVPIQAVDRTDVEKWVAKLRTTETDRSARATAAAVATKTTRPAPDYLSPKTIKNVQGLLSSVLDLQVERGRLQENPAKGTPLPKNFRKRQSVFMTDPQVAALIAELPTEWRPFIQFLLATGLRWSEATALTPESFNFTVTPATVTVNQAWKKDGGRAYLVTPKSLAALRTITIPGTVARQVRPAVDGAGPTKLVFQGPRGGRLKSTWFHAKIWQNAVRDAKISPIPRIHDCRHTHASMLLGAGVPITFVQYCLGHESITTTIKEYGHLIPNAGKISADATEAAMLQALPGLLPSPTADDATDATTA